MKTWHEFYESRKGDGYVSYCKRQYAPFINAIADLRESEMREEGCAIGTITRVLLQLGMNSQLTATDINPYLVLYCRETLPAPVWKADILRAQGKTGLVFSHGVLEHFSVTDMKRIIARQMAEARTVVHYVPTNLYETPSYGDERLESVGWWKENLKPTSVRQFNAGKDLILVWR